MNDPVDDIMKIYETKSKGIHVPNPELEFQKKAKEQSKGLLDKYFSRNPSQTVVEQTSSQPSQTSGETLLTEKQIRNQSLHLAALNIAKVIPLFESKEDKKYLKEIREAIEELME